MHAASCRVVYEGSKGAGRVHGVCAYSSSVLVGGEAGGGWRVAGVGGAGGAGEEVVPMVPTFFSSSCGEAEEEEWCDACVCAVCTCMVVCSV